MKFVILIILLTSCTLKPYRLTVGISKNNAEFTKITEDDDGNKDEEKLCVEAVNEDISNSEKCGDGLRQDEGIGYIDPWIELYPSYFGKSNFGWSYFFAFNRSSTTLLDYPNSGEKSDIEIDRISFNPIVFYNWGDKYIDNKGMSFRLGIGGAVNYVYKFEVTRQSDNESFDADTKIKPGFAAFIEFNYKWFIFRVENSQIEYEGKKFSDVDSDILKIDNNKVSLYYAYYFK